MLRTWNAHGTRGSGLLHLRPKPLSSANHETVNHAMVMNGVDAILELYLRRGTRRYQESVSQLDHALQAAALAEREGASPALIAAALLHDVGHLLEDDEESALRGLDD